MKIKHKTFAGWTIEKIRGLWNRRQRRDRQRDAKRGRTFEPLEARALMATDLVAFAQALTSSGAKLYGAAWDQQTTTQEQGFADGAVYLPFTEVTNPNHSTNAVGTANNITVFPTWVFANSTRLTGVQTLSALATAAGITIPDDNNVNFSSVYDSATVGQNGAVTVLGGSPLWLGVEGYAPNGDALTYSATIANATAGLNLTTNIPTTNKSLKVSVAGYGDMVFQLHDDLVPVATTHTETLANSGFYSNVPIDRVVSNFVIQAGQSTSSQTGTYQNQYSPELQFNQSGVLAIAKSSAPSSNDASFFVTQGPQRNALDYRYTIIGNLTQGDAVRAAINQQVANSSYDGPPINTVTITGASIFNDAKNSLVELKAPLGASGSADVTITATDQHGHSFSRVYHVTVAPDTFNDPAYLNVIPAQQGSSGVPLQVQLSGVDREGNTIYYNATKPNGNTVNYTLSVDHATGVVTATPPAGFVGSFQFTASAGASSTDNRPDLRTVTVNVAPAAPASVVLDSTSDSGFSSSDGITNAASLKFNISGVTDGSVVKLYDGTNLLTQGTVSGTTISLTFAPTGSFAQGAHNISATQTVSGSESPKATPFALTYDTVSPPAISSTPVTKANVGSQYTYDVQDSLEGTTGFSYALVNPPTGASINAATGVISWTPTAGQLGAQSFSVTAKDAAGNSLTQPQTVNVTVAAAQEVEFKLEILDASLNPITTLHTGENFIVRGSVKDLQTTPTGVFSYYGTINYPGSLASVLGTVQFVAPFTFAPSSDLSTAGVLKDVGAATTSLFNNQPTSAFQTIFTLQMQATHAGTIAFTSGPSSDPANLPVAVFGSNNSIDTSLVRFGGASISVDPGFAAIDDTFNLNEDSSSNSLNVLANDTIVPSSGNVLTITSVGTPNQGGTVTISQDGKSLIYTPAKLSTVPETFTYTIKNQTGDSQTATVHVNLAAINHPPVANADQFTVSDKSQDFILDVLSNDSFAPDTNETLTVTSVTQGNHGGVIKLGPGGAYVTYTPAAGYLGAETFNYTISDGHGGTAQAAVNLTVTNVNDPPAANADTASVDEDSSNNTINVLTNDQVFGVGKTLTITSVGAPNKQGTVTIAGDKKSVVYSPKVLFAGTETFTYTISDGTLTATNTVTVTVKPVDHAPTANDDTVNAFLNAPATFDVLANDSFLPDPPKTLTVQSVTPAAHGTAVVGANGANIQYTPANGYTGPDTFSYTITDPAGKTATAHVNVTVQQYAPSSLSGNIYFDVNGNGVFESTEAPISGVTVTLTGTDANNASVNKSAKTDAYGHYTFTNLLPGSYTLTESQLAFVSMPGNNSPGSDGGLAPKGSDTITLTLAQGKTATNYNFGEVGRTVPQIHMEDFYSSNSRTHVLVVLNTSTGEAWHSVSGADWQGFSNATFSQPGANQLKVAVANNATTQSTAIVDLTNTEKARQLGQQGSFVYYQLYNLPTNFTTTPITSASVPSGEGESAPVAALQTTNSSGIAPEGESPLVASGLILPSASSPPANSAVQVGGATSAASVVPQVAASPAAQVDAALTDAEENNENWTGAIDPAAFYSSNSAADEEATDAALGQLTSWTGS